MWNKLLCGVGGDSAQQVNHSVLLLLDGLQMGKCSGLVRLDLCQFVYKVLEKSVSFSEHPADKELQPGRGCAFRIKRRGRVRKDIRDMAIVCL